MRNKRSFMPVLCLDSNTINRKVLFIFSLRWNFSSKSKVHARHVGLCKSARSIYSTFRCVSACLSMRERAQMCPSETDSAVAPRQAYFDSCSYEISSHVIVDTIVSIVSRAWDLTNIRKDRLLSELWTFPRIILSIVIDQKKSQVEQLRSYITKTFLRNAEPVKWA